ncbi:MAG: tetratricopeptide repeat protein [Candidatus Niyogibacteria bacterium]|nr:MAG: tetratricopeptide repeat protein [Candidatus Niyogibacteria bacterium]
MNLKFKPLLPLFLLVIVAVAGYFIWRDQKVPLPLPPPLFEPEPESEPSSAAAELGSESAVIDKNIPDLERPIKVVVGISKERRQQLILDIQEVSLMLKGNYNYLQGWLQLGILRKSAGDYEGAIEAWSFAGIIRPNIATSFLNSADLYAYYIHNNQKAEESFSKAIQAEPKNGFVYYQMAGFYREVMGDISRAREVLEQGISAGADPTGDIQLFLDSLQ